MVSYIIVQLSTDKWSVYSLISKEILGFYSTKYSAIRKVKTLIQKQGGLHIFEVIQGDVSHFYRNDENFNYSEFDYNAIILDSQIESKDNYVFDNNEQSSLNEDDLSDFRVWADGTVQEVSEEPYLWKSDDYMIVKALDEEHAFFVWQQKEREAWGYEPEILGKGFRATGAMRRARALLHGNPQAPPS